MWWHWRKKEKKKKTYLVHGAVVSLNASLCHLAVVPGTNICTSIHSMLTVFNAKLIFL